MIATMAAERRWLAPEVVQTSAMDCGPAALKCLLEGFGIPVSYGRLREACQTSVDGTSIDALEEVALQLGLNAVQVMLPSDHLLLPDSTALPALVVVLQPGGATHFLVVWRLHGRWVQIMDPSGGRRWLSRQQFLDKLYIHQQPVPAADWRDWAASEEFCEPLKQRLQQLGLSAEECEQQLQQALQYPGWHGLAALDAAVRMISALVRGGGLEAGLEAARALTEFYRQAYEDAQSNTDSPTIPESYWSVRLLPDEDGSAEPTLLLKGAVLLQVLGQRIEEQVPVEPNQAEPSQAEPTQAEPSQAEPDLETPSLSIELASALDEAPSQPEKELLNVFKQDGVLVAALIAFALSLATVGVLIEALLFRGLLSLGQGLGMIEYQLEAFAALFIFLIAMLLLEYPLSAAETRFGRLLENRLRMRFMAKIPRLHDRYFSSRLTSDMAHRVYELRDLRDLPQLVFLFLRLNFELLLTTLGLIWIHPAGAWIALLALLVTVGLWLLSQPLLIEQDLNLRTHEGALGRFYLDSLLGLTPIRSHGAESAVRREHEALLVQWVKACLSFYRSYTGIQALSAVLGMLFSVWLLFHYLGHGGATSGVLLLFYWTMKLPVLGRGLAQVLQQYPMQRNRILRLLEPLNAPDEADLSDQQSADTDRGSVSSGVKIELQRLHVQAGGHNILNDINLVIERGEHIAVVGSSGAGKSSLVGLLLGWHRPAAGRILIDDQPLDSAHLQLLRRETAWVDPAVQIWNRSLLDNLRYGNQAEDTGRMNAAIERADLFGVLQRLPDGMQTGLGEGGGLVSGGEGQRVRLARALLRADVRLVILDEPFRGLDRGQRRRLLQQMRQHWADTTLIFISHDVGDTLDS